MKWLRQQVCLISLPSRPKPMVTSLLSHLPYSSSSSSFHSPDSISTLTQQDLTKINLLIPRLCSSNHLSTAIQLTTAALLSSPPLNSLPLSILIHSLTSEPDMVQPMSLLTRLKHSPPSHPYLKPIITLLIASFFKVHRPKEAGKVFNWMMRPDSPCAPDELIYGILVDGFCRNGLLLEALKVLNAMVDANLAPGSNLKKRVYMGLLREARIKEAKELNEALSCVGDGCDESLKKVLDILDEMIKNWTE